MLAGLLLAGCTVEVGPPPESDPPLVPETAKAPPPPPQPSEPQPWSRDLDLKSVPVAADRERMVEGLVAGDVQASYSAERLTFESAFNPEKPPSEAEWARQRAQQRAAAAGLPPPPQVAAAPVTEVESQALPPAGETAAPARRESRLPPPPKLPPQAPETAEASAEALEAPPPAETAAGSGAVDDGATVDTWASRQSRLPSPPKFPPQQPDEPAVAAEPSSPQTSGAPETPTAAVADAAATAATFAADAWDAPPGTILVQVSAVADGNKISEEWQRLQALYPQELKPLRLVVEEARLGDRGVFFRVQAGAFGSREGAVAACDSLVGQGQACFVVVR